MNTRDLQTALVNWTVLHSGHDGKRSYIGLSGIGDCERAIYDRFQAGYEAPTVADHLKHKISYELEAAFIERLKLMGLYKPPETITLFDGLVQGHTDGRIDADVLEITTVAVEDHFPEPGRIPRRKYWQVQAYLHYLQRARAHVIYLARASGAFVPFFVSYNARIGAEIEAKVGRLVEAARTCTRPACSCNRCGIGRIVDGGAVVVGQGV